MIDTTVWTPAASVRRYALIQPDGQARPILLGSIDDQRAVLGGPADYGDLSRHFGYLVYEFSITNNLPLNAHMRRGDRDVLIAGPCLIYKVNDRGETIDVTDADVARIEHLWQQARAGLNPDSLTLE